MPDFRKAGETGEMGFFVRRSSVTKEFEGKASVGRGKNASKARMKKCKGSLLIAVISVCMNLSFRR